MAKFNLKAKTVPQIMKFLGQVFPEFSAASTYKKGAFVIYNTMTDAGTATYCSVYRANSDLAAAAWNAANWTAVTDGNTLAEAINECLSGDVIAVEFAAATAYDAGEYVMHNGALYKAKVPHASGVAWSDANWEAVTVGDELERLDDVVHNFAPEYDATETYNDGDVVVYEDKLYTCNADGTTGAFNPSKWDESTVVEVIEGASVNLSAIAPTYAESGVAYTAGDYVIYNNTLYCAKENIAAPAGTFNPAKWDSTDVATELQDYTLRAKVAGEYNTGTTYKEGDLVFYNKELYYCKMDGTTGAWNAAKWTAVTLDDVFEGLRTSGINAPYYSEQAFVAGDLCTHGNKMYLCISSVSAGSPWDESKWQETTVSEQLKLKAALPTLAPTYNASTTYGVGDLVTYDGNLYKCKTAGTTGTFDPTKWDITTISAEVASAGADFSLIATPYATTGVSYAIGDYVLYNAKIYRATAAHAAPAGAWTGAGWTQVVGMDEVKMIAHNGAAAPMYNQSTTYTVGDVVTYGPDAKLYMCKTASTTGAWDGSKWECVNNDAVLNGFVESLAALLGVTVNGRSYNSVTHKVEYDLALSSL